MSLPPLEYTLGGCTLNRYRNFESHAIPNWILRLRKKNSLSRSPANGWIGTDVNYLTDVMPLASGMTIHRLLAQDP
jgi:hypothetical protein